MAVKTNQDIQTSSGFFINELANSSHVFAPIATKILNQERVSYDEGVQLIQSTELFLLGHMANFVRERKAYQTAIARGFDEATAVKRMTQVWWNTNLHLNPTNVCIGECDFCSFARKPNEEGAYTMTIREALDRVAIARSEGATEVHIVGGLNPKTLVEYYSDLIRAIKADSPGIHVKAFTAVEIEFFAKFTKTSYEEIFKTLIEAGLDSMPGGGAEIFSRQVRDEMCPDKIPADEWIKIHQVAHQMGLRTNATMLAGIGEEAHERVEHLDILRKAQDESLAILQAQGSLEANQKGSSGAWQTFIPLSCHYEGNDLLERGVKPLTGYDQLKNIAVSRIMLDNFDNIKAYWIQLGEKMAQLALSFGANDLDGTVKAERITRAAGANKRSLAEENLENLIQGAGFEAIERDTTYNPIELSEHRVLVNH
ncbi:MAG: CofH family radical SAM protein [Candidatus Melainabacteria bacterium]|jgi:aminodeoxyfutalosine synthase|nr:CofH family radical SAM protein [Candidatus Melainabacteria bacterium]